MGVPDDLSLFNNFIRSLTKNQTELHIDNGVKLKLLEYLNKNKLMGYRGHDKWDKVALILIYLFSVASIAAIFQSAFKTLHIFLPHYPLALIIIIKIVFFGFALFVGLVLTGIIIIIFRKFFPIQKDPDPNKLKKLCPSLFDEKKTD